jgi:hypothetical protein
VRRTLYWLFAVSLVFIGWRHLRQDRLATLEAAEPPADVADLPVERSDSGAGRAPGSVSHSCDGREYCSQMTSCAEATWFLKHCPGMKMDGDGDGIPCEKQWCGG